jgi:hypothetical protein
MPKGLMMIRIDPKNMTREERVAFYRKQIERLRPPRNRKQAVLLEVYQQLLASANDSGAET